MILFSIHIFVLSFVQSSVPSNEKNIEKEIRSSRSSSTWISGIIPLAYVVAIIEMALKIPKT